CRRPPRAPEEPLPPPPRRARALTRRGFQASHAGRHSALAAQLDEAYVAGASDVRPAAQLGGEVAHADHPHPVAVLVTEERERTRTDGLVVPHLLPPHLAVGPNP